MIKLTLTLIVLLSLILFLNKNDLFFNLKIKNIDNKSTNNEIKKKYLIECELFNEIIDRNNRDTERQCYYECNEDDIVRVDTSIEYICQPFILEER